MAKTVKNVGVWLLIIYLGAIAGLNGYWIVRGLETGSIETLHKAGNWMVLYEVQPLIFAINLVIRALIVIVCAGCVATFVYEELKRARHWVQRQRTGPPPANSSAADDDTFRHSDGAPLLLPLPAGERVGERGNDVAGKTPDASCKKTARR